MTTATKKKLALAALAAITLAGLAKIAGPQVTAAWRAYEAGERAAGRPLPKTTFSQLSEVRGFLREVGTENHKKLSQHIHSQLMSLRGHDRHVAEQLGGGFWSHLKDHKKKIIGGVAALGTLAALAGASHLGAHQLQKACLKPETKHLRVTAISWSNTTRGLPKLIQGVGDTAAAATSAVANSSAANAVRGGIASAAMSTARQLSKRGRPDLAIGARQLAETVNPKMSVMKKAGNFVSNILDSSDM
jgi:hypothetical protein